MDFNRHAQVVKLYKFIFLVLFLSLKLWAYPELVSLNKCTYCHTQTSGLGPLTEQGLNFSKKSSDFNLRYFKIDSSPEWLRVGLKYDLTQSFSRNQYVSEGQFKTTRSEVQLDIAPSFDRFNFRLSGSINRFDPQGPKDSATDFIYTPYTFIDVSYKEDLVDQEIHLKHGFYVTEAQNNLRESVAKNFLQTELSYLNLYSQFSVASLQGLENYKRQDKINGYELSLKYLNNEKSNMLLDYQFISKKNQTKTLQINYKKNQLWTVRFILAEEDKNDLKGIIFKLLPFYFINQNLKSYFGLSYKNSDIQKANPRQFIYSAGLDYLIAPQAQVQLQIRRNDDSGEINDPTNSVQLNLHVFM